MKPDSRVLLVGESNFLQLKIGPWPEPTVAHSKCLLVVRLSWSSGPIKNWAYQKLPSIMTESQGQLDLSRGHEIEIADGCKEESERKDTPKSLST